MVLHRCILVLSIFACYFTCVRGRIVDCEKYPFHMQCRGIQTRKRYMGIGNGLSGESSYSRDTQTSKIPISVLKEQRHSVSSLQQPEYRSNLWSILLDKGLDNDALYEAYTTAGRRRYNGHVRRNKEDIGNNNGNNNNEEEEDNSVSDHRLNHQRIPTLLDFSSELDRLDGDY
ncbi:uncharacterized protein LOC105697180 [Orussus abietinus]|uniref:uncharacterized protein LOC105697180 n=1 Tax=Orussus abietinus TaxID=222816 RepID=UPI0006252D99|nr:uncharacterized protein LOC105697180 [Orussus abietinus]XP_023289610.1 uncharacterized protein LOC105697180 [Orussus abietinus]